MTDQSQRQKGREGQGYATEAASALRAYVYDNEILKTLVSYIDPRNDRSIALAERMGAALDPNAKEPDPGCLVYRHPGPEAITGVI